MNAPISWFVAVTIAVSTSGMTSAGHASTFEWDFSGTLSSASGAGNSQPGLVPGAAITGSYRGDTRDFYFVDSYVGFLGPVTIYRNSFATLNYSATYRGASYTYSGYEIEPTITIADSYAEFQLWGGGWFEFNKVVYRYSGDSSLTSFFSEMAAGLSDGGVSITIGDGNWANSVYGSLSSLGVTPVPEPSVTALCALGLFVGLGLRLRH